MSTITFNALINDLHFDPKKGTLKLLDSFCGDKTYDEVITSLIQKELAEDEHQS